MVTVSIIAFVIYILSIVFRGTLIYIEKEHPGDYKARAFFRALSNILHGTFWVIVYTMGIVTIIRLIWGG